MGQIAQIERFLDKPVAAAGQYGGRLPVDAVPAGEQRLELGIDGFEPVVHLSAAHFRHDHVKYHHVDAGWILGIDVDGLGTAVGADNPIPETLQHLSAHIDDHGLVVHQ